MINSIIEIILAVLAACFMVGFITIGLILISNFTAFVITHFVDKDMDVLRYLKLFLVQDKEN